MVAFMAGDTFLFWGMGIVFVGFMLWIGLADQIKEAMTALKKEEEDKKKGIYKNAPSDMAELDNCRRHILARRYKDWEHDILHLFVLKFKEGLLVIAV